MRKELAFELIAEMLLVEIGLSGDVLFREKRRLSIQALGLPHGAKLAQRFDSDIGIDYGLGAAVPPDVVGSNVGDRA